MIPHTGARIAFQPRIRKGAFFEAAWRHGCRNFSVYNRTYISGSFSDPESEYWQVVNDVALWPAMGERQVEISGPDASRFVQLLTPRNMDKCAIGQCKYALITSPSGGVFSDPIILRLEPNRYWLSTSDWDLEHWALGLSVNSGMNVSIRDANVSVIQVQGPKSPVLMANLLGETILDLKYYWWTSVPFANSELIVSRTGWSGEFGYEIYLQDASLGDELFEALMAAGKSSNVAPGSVNQTRRIESGILSAGVDVTSQETPFEVGLGRLVELDHDAPFVGREALARAKDQPLSKKLIGLKIDGKRLAPNEDPWRITNAADQQIGRLTSCTWSPRLEGNIALGVIKSDAAELDTRVRVETWDGSRDATISKTLFIPKRQAEDPHALYQQSKI